MYIGKDINDATGLIEIAFEQLIASKESIDKVAQAVKSKKINKDLSYDDQIEEAFAQKIIQQDERDNLRLFEEYRKKVISVDEFSCDSTVEG